MSKVKVRFLINKEQKRVVFAEAGSDFVDVLFSFLTMPLGSIVRLLNKQSGLGSLDSLYESVEQLDVKYLQTEECLEMLLNPRSAAAQLCEDLKVKNIHDPNPRNFYFCKENGCLVQSISYFSYTKKGQCSRCGKLMNKCWQWGKTASNGVGVFVKDTVDFMITDDLRVIPTSLMKACSLLKEMQIKDTNNLEERMIELGTEEILNLLRRSLVSKDALTHVCFPDTCMQASSNFPLPIKEEMVCKEEMVASDSGQKIILNLLVNKESNVVLYAEVGEDFVNQLLSFLTFPLGSVLRFLPDAVSSRPLAGCINNLYSSAKIIDLDCFKSEICRNMLLTPKLPNFYGIRRQILKSEEIASNKLSILAGCIKCYWDNGHKPCTSAPCIHGIKSALVIEKNPKSTKVVMCSGLDFVVGSRKFMIADDLHISPISFISAIDNGINMPVFDVISKEVSVDKNKAQLLLGALLISKSVLTDVFSPRFTADTKNSKKTLREDEDLANQETKKPKKE